MTPGLHFSNQRNPSSNSIVLIAPTYSYRASVYLSAAERHGIPLIFVTDGNSEISPRSRSGIRVDFSNLESVLESVAEQLEGENVGAVIAPDEKFVEIAAKVANRLGLPHNRVESLRPSVNKFLAREILSQSSVLVPDYWMIDVDDEVEKQIQDVKLPCVAKPTNLSASRGVIRANTKSELLEAIERIRNILAQEQRSDLDSTVLIEQYIPGSEHSLEGYLTNGQLETVCIFDKPDPLEGPYFEETCFVTPSTLNDEVQMNIRKSVFEACQAYGLEIGPIHAEVRVCNSKVWILEVAARSIGGDCARLFELATDSSLEEYILCKSAGHSIRSLEFSRSSGVAMIPVTTEGILRRIEGVIDAQSVEGILDVRIDVRAGEKMIPWPEGSKYPGFIYAQAESPELVEHSLRQALDQIKFVCMPEFPLTVDDSKVEQFNSSFSIDS